MAWSYWLGVGQKTADEYAKINKNYSDGITTLGALTGCGALATLAVTGISMFAVPTVGDNVQYKFYTNYNGQPLTLDYGNVVSASGRNNKITQGGFNIELFNDNFKDGIDVSVKVVVVQVSKTWEDVPYTQQKITPVKEKQIFNEPIIQTRQIPVIIE